MQTMKRTVLTFVPAGVTALYGFVTAQRKSTERREPHGISKETFWSKLRELWAIRQRCRQIKLQQQQNPPLRSNKLSASFLRRNSPQTTDLSQ
jgi:hypothetical protein